MATSLTDWADGLFTYDSDHFAMGLHFPLRMTGLRLGDGSLLLHSPVGIDDDLAQALSDRGQVATLLAPNRFHHLYLAPAQTRYPHAKCFGPPGLRKKRPDIRFEADLEPLAKPPYSEDLEVVLVSGIRALSEIVVYHRKSRTLILTDLLMNIHQTKGWLSKTVYRLEGCYRRPGVPRIIQWAPRDRNLARQQIQSILAWPFERVILAHGDPIVDSPRPVLEAAFERFLR